MKVLNSQNFRFTLRLRLDYDQNSAGHTVLLEKGWFLLLCKLPSKSKYSSFVQHKYCCPPLFLLSTRPSSKWVKECWDSSTAIFDTFFFVYWRRKTSTKRNLANSLTCWWCPGSFNISNIVLVQWKTTPCTSKIPSRLIVLSHSIMLPEGMTSCKRADVSLLILTLWRKIAYWRNRMEK